jgi:hypothetical protein
MFSPWWQFRCNARGRATLSAAPQLLRSNNEDDGNGCEQQSVGTPGLFFPVFYL